MKDVSKILNINTSSFSTNELIDEAFLAEIVHKAKNSLGGINGFATLLKRDLDPDDPKQRLAQRVEEGVFRLNEFIESLMTLVRIVEPKKKNVQLNRLVKDVLTNNYSEQKQLFDDSDVWSKFFEAKVNIQGDSTMLQHLFFHIIRAANLMNGKVKSVRIIPEDTSVNVDFTLVDCDGLEKSSVDFDQFVKNCEFVEIRLSLSIIIKMVKIHHGKVQTHMISPNQYIMSICLPRDNPL